MTDGFYVEVVRKTTALVSNNTSLFQATGFALFRGISILMLGYEGFKVATNTQSSGRLLSLLMSVAAVDVAMNYYGAPFPGIGRNLTQVVTDFGVELTAKIDTSGIEMAGRAMSDILGRLSGTTWSAITNPGVYIRYWLFWSAIAVMQIAMLGVIGYGFIAIGVLMLIGPVMIPFALVPGLDYLASGWLRSLIGYSLYPVVGAAFVQVYASVMLDYLGQFTGASIDIDIAAAAVLQVVVLSMSCVYGILKVPQFVAGIVGAAGISAVPTFKWWR